MGNQWIIICFAGVLSVLMVLLLWWLAKNNKYDRQVVPSETERLSDTEIPEIPLEIGAEAIRAKTRAEQLAWENRPICCGVKVNAFDDGSYICKICQKIIG